MSVSFHQAVRRHSQEDSNLHIHRCGNLKPHTVLLQPQSIQTDQVSRNLYLKPTDPCIITPCSSEPATFHRNASPPSSGLKQQDMSVLLISCLDYYSILMMEAESSSEISDSVRTTRPWEPPFKKAGISLNYVASDSPRIIRCMYSSCIIYIEIKFDCFIWLGTSGVRGWIFVYAFQ